MTVDDVKRLIAAMGLSARDEREARALSDRLRVFLIAELDGLKDRADNPVMVQQTAVAIALACGEAAIAQIRSRKGAAGE